MDLRLRLANTNSAPAIGSVLSFCRQTCANPSMPLRKSTGSTASSNRICGVI